MDKSQWKKPDSQHHYIKGRGIDICVDCGVVQIITHIPPNGVKWTYLNNGMVNIDTRIEPPCIKRVDN